MTRAYKHGKPIVVASLAYWPSFASLFGLLLWGNAVAGGMVRHRADRRQQRRRDPVFVLRGFR